MRPDRGRRGRAAAALLSLAFLASGCASMPSTGEVTRVESSNSAEHESRVRVYGVSPQKGLGPQDIVQGFLEATTSDEPRFSTAKEYLTKETAKEWDPFARTVVVEGAPTTRPAKQNKGEGAGYTVAVSGVRTATLDARNAYDADRAEFTEEFHLTEVEGKGWRIDRLPAGVILGEADFERIYRSVNTYYYARLGPSAESVSRGRDVLVADPVYVRSRIDPVAETVRALFEGPTTFLDPVVATAFPEGTRLARKSSVSVSDAGTVTVWLNGKGASAGGARCERMAAQVVHSVQSQASSKLENVRLKGPGGRLMCELTQDEADLYEPGRLGGPGTRPYFIDAEGRVAAIEPGSREPAVVHGPLGSGDLVFGSVGVSRDERKAAAVTADGRALYMAAMTRTAEPSAPVLTSDAVKEENRLSAPSWDGLGDLWIADRDPRDPKLLRLRGGQAEPEVVEVPGLGRNERIESLRISSDGVRIALRVEGPGGHTSLELGRVERTGTRENPSLSVTALHGVAPQLEDVVAVSWSGDSELVVVGREARGVQQLQYIGTDGSTAHQPQLPGINDVQGVAASEEEGRALLAESRYGIVRLPPDSSWKTVAEDGTAPVYPG